MQARGVVTAEPSLDEKTGVNAPNSTPLLNRALISQVFCALDGEAGGTFMGMNAKTGQYAVLTNMRHIHGPPPGPNISRGEVVMKHLLGQDDEEVNRFLREEGNAFNGFNVLYGNALRESQMKAQLPARFTSNAPSASGVPGQWRPRTEFVHKHTSYACSNSAGSNQDHWPKVFTPSAALLFTYTWRFHDHDRCTLLCRNYALKAPLSEHGAAIAVCMVES